MRKRVIVTVIAVVVVLAAVGLYTFLDHLSNELALRLRPDACTARGADQVTLSPTQAANAATIAAVGIRRGLPERAITIALATAMQESKLQNLTGGDRDSLGLFQQRPSQGWGSAAQIGDPRYAAGEFYTALMKVRGWQTMPITQAAQAVQKSAHPDAYQKWVADATVLAAALYGETGNSLTCAYHDPSTSARGQAAVTAVVASLRLDWGDVATSPAPGGTGVTVAVSDERDGWRYANWLVAHGQAAGLSQVRYLNQQWTARGGTWSRIDQNSPTAIVALVSG